MQQAVFDLFTAIYTDKKLIDLIGWFQLGRLSSRLSNRTFNQYLCTGNMYIWTWSSGITKPRKHIILNKQKILALLNQDLLLIYISSKFPFVL
ncbi:hypothetical protein TH53_17485 [Pedobacter lusitanus]|uniref:Contig76, whole genome shotgun sequence n=1 Tax=Pedobacter lusitanus TaxID=1503925 RepID=A0A0D0GFC4_9SPHI|nr:hypothetical protein TH53_17485 [Pedobacter lusitanus]